jgi:hypothetical protein
MDLADFLDICEYIHKNGTFETVLVCENYIEEVKKAIQLKMITESSLYYLNFLSNEHVRH